MNASAQQEMRSSLNRENMSSQISDHLMADRRSSTLTETPSVNKHQVECYMKTRPRSRPWISVPPPSSIILPSWKCVNYKVSRIWIVA